jgi:hypothetical protein
MHAKKLERWRGGGLEFMQITAEAAAEATETARLVTLRWTQAHN